MSAQSFSGPLVTPKRLFGYDVIDRIGEGAASVIYAVSDPANHQVYALKHVVRKTDRDDRYIQQVLNEWEVSRACLHPILRKCIDLKTHKKFFGPVTEAALLMELVDGVPMDDNPMKDLGQIIQVFLNVALALWEMAKAGYVHCDTKPGNILISSEGGVKVIDFGQACKTGTVKERVQGTPSFIAPEQARCKPLTEQTDVYNFGATLYWALTGQRVPTLLTVEKSERHVVREQDYPSPVDLNPGVPPDLSELVMNCLRLRPWERIAGMGKVHMRLEQVKR